MAKDIWDVCQGSMHVGRIHQKVWRVVEAQETAATRKLVDSLEEQIILEELIETAKPVVPADYEHYHPLLYTAFRYPPLKYGSRFGSQFESSLWYGSYTLNTCLAEKAFYQYHFIRGSEADFGMVTLQLTVFSVEVKTDNGVNLIHAPFVQHKEIISSPTRYEASQQLGLRMREAGVYAFNYFSARDADGGVNIGVFNPQAFTKKNPDIRSFQSWRCVVDNDAVEFTRSSAVDFEAYRFPKTSFLVNGQLPFPAS